MRFDQWIEDANFTSIPSGCVGFPKGLQSKTEDDDVAAERERVHADPNNTSGDVLRMVDLVKVTSPRLRREREILVLRSTDGDGGKRSLLSNERVWA